MKTNLILIGMPGCGKSTCGVLAAKAMCKSFVDTDLLIQVREGMGLQQLINTRGSEYFAGAERGALLSFDGENAVVATGGSAVYCEDAMEYLKQNGFTVYLKIGFEEMMRRIQNIKTRGILLEQGETLEAMFRKREALYTRFADVTIDCDNADIEQTVERICKAYQLNNE